MGYFWDIFHPHRLSLELLYFNGPNSILVFCLTVLCHYLPKELLCGFKEFNKVVSEALVTNPQRNIMQNYLSADVLFFAEELISSISQKVFIKSIFEGADAVNFDKTVDDELECCLYNLN